jgi:hypothetical protein
MNHLPLRRNLLILLVLNLYIGIWYVSLASFYVESHFTCTYDYIVSAYNIITYEYYCLYPGLRFDTNKNARGYRRVSRKRRPDMNSRGVIWDHVVHLVQQLHKSLATLSIVTRFIVLPGSDIIHLAETIFHNNRINKLLWACEDRKPTRCYTMVYWPYGSLNMFRTLLCPSSGDWDYTDDHSMWHITLDG